MDKKELDELKKKVKEALDIDRHTLVMKFPFTGGISLKMNLIPTRDALNPTACTDGKNIFFDCAFYTDLSPKERVFVLGHEIWHCIMLHLARKQIRDETLWNIATDMEVNHLLELNAKDGILVPPKQVLFPPNRYKDKSAEFLYDLLLKQMQSSGSGSSGSQSQKSKQKSSQKIQDPNSSFDDNDSDDEGNEGNSSSSGNELKDAIKKAQQKKNGQHKGELSGQFDNHKYVGEGADQQKSKDKSQSDGNGQDAEGQEDNEGNESDGTGNSSSGNGYPTRQDKYGTVGRDDDFNPKVGDDFAEEMRETIVAQVQQCERQQGTLPAGLESILEKLEKPEIPWHEVLSQFVTMCYNGRRRWNPPARRHLYNEMYFQSRRDEKIKVAVAIDTSGSCIGDLPKFFGELVGLLKSFGSYELHLIQCDAAVDKYELYDDGNPFDVDNVQNIEWCGGGGTSFKPPFKYLEQHNITPDCFVYLTDSYGDAPEYPPPYPVLWVLTADGNKDFCDWGQKIMFKNSSGNRDGSW